MSIPHRRQTGRVVEAEDQGTDPEVVASRRQDRADPVNQILRGWANYFKHAVAKHTMQRLHTFVWWRVVCWVMHRHRMTWRAIQRWLRTPQGWWKPIELDGIRLFDLGRAPITRYRYRGKAIPSPWPEALTGPAPTA